MKINAAVIPKINTLSIETVELNPPQAGELLVKMKAAGVCHSDLHTLQGTLSAEPPLVLGHEGAGVVAEVGPGVTGFKPGQPLLINWLPACGHCDYCWRGHFNLCRRYNNTSYAGKMLDGTSRLRRANGDELKHYLGAATMAEYVVINQAQAIPLPENVPFDVAAIIGCAVVTGVGAVLNTARIKPGSSAAVIGCGGVGLSILLGCKLAGCYPIVALDVGLKKLQFAKELGADITLQVTEPEMVAHSLREKLNSDGPDYVFDSVGGRNTIPQALQAVRPGGTAVVVGMHDAKQALPFTPADLVFYSKKLLGSFVGDVNPAVDLPFLIELYRAGKLPLDRLIANHYPLAQLDQAFTAMQAGVVGRNIIHFP